MTNELWDGIIGKLSDERPEARRQRTVPCKLNNAKTNKHLGQFIMDCLSIDFEIELTANENS